MPHFIIDCSANVLEMISPQLLMEAVYSEADATGLFAQHDIKIRLQPYSLYQLGDGKSSFLHVFAYIMQGRSTGQKAGLSAKITSRLHQLLPEISFLSMNVSEFASDTYCNKALINPENKTRDRHFGL